MDSELPPLDIAEARKQIGERWGLDRAVTRAELARALRLSPKYGGDFVGRLESKKAALSGPIWVSIKAIANGYRPENMDDVIKPGYPRGEVV